MDAATSATLTGCSNDRLEPSGSCTEIILCLQQKKSAVEAALSFDRKTKGELVRADSTAGERSSEHRHRHFLKRC
jgi:hypothetical protein